MIDPRLTPTAMLPILNAVAAHSIARAAPLRVANCVDTEQMVAEATEECGIDPEHVEEELERYAPHRNYQISGFFHWTRIIVPGWRPLSANAECFLRTLDCVVDRSV